MGLNLLKWVYTLGVKHERDRIANALDRASMAIRDHRDELFLESMTKIDEERATKLRYRQNVVSEVGRVIDSLFQPTNQYVPGASIMFPKEEK